MNTSSTATTTVLTLRDSFSTVLAAFLADSIADIVPWILACIAAIVCDLIFGLRKSALMGEDIRISREIRDTMTKTAGYFAFVIMACFINTAAGGEYNIDRWLCFLVCANEVISIIENILEPKGIKISINIISIISLIIAKITGISKADLSEAITSTSDDQNPAKTPENASDGHSTNTNQ